MSLKTLASLGVVYISSSAPSLGRTKFFAVPSGLDVFLRPIRVLYLPVFSTCKETPSPSSLNVLNILSVSMYLDKPLTVATICC